MASIRIKIVDGRVHFWRTEKVGRGRERMVKGTKGEFAVGEKFPRDHRAFNQGGKPTEE